MAEVFTAPEYKYTDRHVREDDNLQRLAEAYTRVYGGDFEPLVRAKNELASRGCLSTRTARVVLNCMRYDVNVSASLPVPTLAAVRLDHLQAEPEDLECSNPEPHHSHRLWRGNVISDCPGVPWEVTRRQWIQTAVKVKAPFATARTGKAIHRTSGQGWQIWYPPAHEYGPAHRGELVVDLICKYPSKITAPILFMEEPATLHQYNAIETPRGRCIHGCFE